jgi:hypothetical protein
LIIYYIDFIYNCICYDVCNSTDILCIILWPSPYPWDVPVKGNMEVNKNWGTIEKYLEIFFLDACGINLLSWLSLKFA